MSGRPPERNWSWDHRTRPFFDAHGAEPARFVLEQTGDASFRLADGSAFVCRLPGRQPLTVTPESLGETDLASIPGYLSWFVTRYGRHTPAALVHDQLVVGGMRARDRESADDLFLELMAATDVPLVRRTVMWSAVALATRWRSGAAARVGVVLWLVAATVGLTAIVAGIATGHGWWVLAGVLGPVPGCLLWGRRWRPGLVGGFALPLVAFPAGGSWLGYALYWLIEELVRRLRSVPKGRDVEDLPTPVAYKER